MRTAERIPAPYRDDQRGELDRTLALAFRLVAAVEVLAMQLAVPEIGDIELPPSMASAADQAHLRTVAPLYLAAELEAGRVVPAVEALAGIFLSGGLPADFGSADAQLARFWQGRHQRFAPLERQAFFARLFGDERGPELATTDGARNTDFDSLMIDLCGALAAFSPPPSPGLSGSVEMPVRVAASALSANLLQRSGSMAVYAARDILTTIHDALAILKEPLLQQALGAHSVWGAVAAIARQYLREDIDVASHVTRGKSGMLVLAWLAERLPLLDDSASQLFMSDFSVMGAATSWLQASLTLHEHDASPVPQRG